MCCVPFAGFEPAIFAEQAHCVVRVYAITRISQDHIRFLPHKIAYLLVVQPNGSAQKKKGENITFKDL